MKRKYEVVKYDPGYPGYPVWTVGYFDNDEWIPVEDYPKEVTAKRTATKLNKIEEYRCIPG